MVTFCMRVADLAVFCIIFPNMSTFMFEVINIFISLTDCNKSRHLLSTMSVSGITSVLIVGSLVVANYARTVSYLS